MASALLVISDMSWRSNRLRESRDTFEVKLSLPLHGLVIPYPLVNIKNIDLLLKIRLFLSIHMFHKMLLQSLLCFLYYFVFTVQPTSNIGL